MTSTISLQAPVLLSDAPLPAWLLRNRVCAGFPSPAEDPAAGGAPSGDVLSSGQRSIDDRGRHFDNDILVVDRAIKPRHNHIVVGIVDGDFTVKRLYQRLGRIKLQAANPTYPDIVPKDGQRFCRDNGLWPKRVASLSW